MLLFDGSKNVLLDNVVEQHVPIIARTKYCDTFIFELARFWDFYLAIEQSNAILSSILEFTLMVFKTNPYILKQFYKQRKENKMFYK